MKLTKSYLKTLVKEVLNESRSITEDLPLKRTQRNKVIFKDNQTKEAIKEIIRLMKIYAP